MDYLCCFCIKKGGGGGRKGKKRKATRRECRRDPAHNCEVGFDQKKNCEVGRAPQKSSDSEPRQRLQPSLRPSSTALLLFSFFDGWWGGAPPTPPSVRDSHVATWRLQRGPPHKTTEGGTPTMWDRHEPRVNSNWWRRQIALYAPP